MLSNCGAREDPWESPWTARRSNQSILKEINPEYSLEGMILKLQNFGHLIRRADSLEKSLMLGKIEGKRQSGQKRMRWLDGITVSVDMTLSMLLEMVEDTEAWWASVLGVAKNQTWLSNWMTSLFNYKRRRWDAINWQLGQKQRKLYPPRWRLGHLSNFPDKTIVI